MKQCVILLLAILLFLPLTLKAQMPYYDALDLKKLKFIERNGILFFPVTDTANKRASEILAKYLDTEDPSKVSDVFGNNPFFRVAPLNAQSSSNFNKIESDLLGGIGGINVTNFADGLAKFLVERTKEELTATFFEKFKSELDSIEELNIMFPKTHDLLQSIDQEIYNISAYLNMLRETFTQDLKTIIPNLRRLINSSELDKYFDLNPTVKFVLNDALLIAEDLQSGKHPGDVITRLKNEAKTTAPIKYYKPSLESIDLISQSLRSKQKERYWVPSDSVALLVKDKVAFKIYLGLVYQKADGIEFKDDLSFRTVLDDVHTTELKKEALGNYISEIAANAQRVDEALKSVKALNQSDSKNYENHFQFYSAALDLMEQAMQFRGVDKLSELIGVEQEAEIKDFLSIARTSGGLYLNITQKKYFPAVLDLSTILSEGFVNDLAKYNASINSVDDLVKDLRKIKKKPSGEVTAKSAFIIDFKRQLKGLLEAIDALGDSIDASVLEKHYESLASGNMPDLNELIKSLETLKIPDTLKSEIVSLEAKLGKLPQLIMKYGNLAAGIAEAQNSEEVKNMIAAVALPAGSSSIKKKTVFNLALNAYVGPAFSREKLNDGPIGLKNEFSGGFGLSTPVGISISVGRKSIKNKYSSFSAFASLIDIGALASFRFNVADSVAIKDANGNSTMASVSELPEIKLENIFAPGLYLVYGVPKAPISFGAGAQYSPQLRKVELTPEDLTLPKIDVQSSLLRFQFFIAIDIPVLNFYSKTR
ncbi:hypothetical protein [Roseivirga sp.]|uniref:hypothetical protein n=1 Tax=Roseivirga sp. TaxID=1964215 RepID=UPI002B267BBA|nr:hypothetical protein [Roseivirga sp.]